MIELASYPTYKDSGAAWLGDIPESWSVVPARTLFEERNTRNRPDEQLLSVTIAKGVLRQSDHLEGTSAKDGSNLDKAGYKLVEPGDIAYNKMRAWQGAAGVSRYQGIVSPAYIVMRSRGELQPSFVHALMRVPAFAKEAERWSYGITSDQWSFRSKDFKQVYFPVPPSEDQAAIVRYLGHIDARVQRLIRAKERLIELLEEEKQAIVYRAVTRGLDPDAPFRPSGLDWLGEVPEHWELAPLGRCLRRIDQGWSPVAAEEDLTDQHWAVLTLSAVRRGKFESDAVKPVPLDATVPARLRLRDGDLLLTRSNTRDRVGDACVVENVRPKSLFSDLIYRLVPRAIDSRFLMYQLLSRLGRTQIERDARGSSGTMPKLSQRHIRSWRVLLPPVEEQRRVVDVLRKATARIDDAVTNAQEHISLVREFRTRLVSDVVTGKLDVREAARDLPLPDVAAPPGNGHLEEAVP